MRWLSFFRLLFLSHAQQRRCERGSRRLPSEETLETRQCLSAIGFVEHPIVCCVSRSLEDSIAVDFDSDGDLDIATMSIDGGLTLLANNAGSFRAVGMSDSLGRVYLASNDFDDDGDQDVVTGSGWLENLGDMKFSTPRPFRSDFGGRIVGMADIDGDAALDLLGVSDDRHTFVWLQRGVDLAVLQPQIVGMIADDDAPFSVGDFDADGDLDLILSEAAPGGSSRLYENTDGAGRFELVENRTFDGTLGTVADLNGDGRVDVITSDAWHENLGIDVGFREHAWPRRGSNRIVAVADLDGDRDVDLLTNIPTWSANNGDGTFREPIQLEKTTHKERSVRPIDMDGDGDLDLLVTAHLGDRLAWHENLDGRGTFSRSNSIFAQVGSALTSLADFDGDGQLDLLASAREAAPVAWYRNQGDGQFSNPQVLVPAAYIVASGSEALPVDLDQDGDLDVVVARWTFGDSRSNVIWLENVDGAGTFRESELGIQTGREAQILTTDVDGDGLSDLVVADLDDASTNALRWYPNLGVGRFGDSQVVDDGGGMISIADMNGDSVADLIRVSRESKRVSVFLNDAGRGQYLAGVTTELETSQPVSSLVQDIDGDGLPDLIIRDGAEVKIFRNNGTRGLSTEADVTFELRLAGTLAAVDVDNDGDLDLIASHVYGFSVYENTNARGMFAWKSFRTAFVRVGRPTAGDIDRDGDLDLLFGSTILPNISWFENRTFGDIDDDGDFDSADLVAALATGQYEDGVRGNSTWYDGDWSGDGEFNSHDLVLAFQAGFNTPRP